MPTLRLVRKKATKELVSAGFCNFDGQFDLADCEQVELEGYDTVDVQQLAQRGVITLPALEDTKGRWRANLTALEKKLPAEALDALRILARALGLE